MNDFRKKRAIVIDGHSLAYRAYFSTFAQLQYYKANNLKPTNAVRMMIIMISKLLSFKNYEYGLVAFDTSRKSFRTEKFENYKSNRKSMPDDMVSQMEIIFEAIEKMGFKILAIPNYEADDIIGTFAKMCSKNDIECDVFTSDQDMLQLVDHKINVNLLKKGVSEIKVYRLDNFTELNEGLNPDQIIDLKAITGDSSDNYKGIPGIGFKTALKLINEYKNIKNIYDNIENLKPNVLQEKFVKNQDLVNLFLELAKIIVDLDIDNNLENYVFKTKDQKAIDEFLNQNQLINLKKYFV